ncbi:prorelaxin-like [Erinaceus europaeus]|uniref:Prorelaxin-like n=1 Tax=Erinaceus europaeus TaxID=9365 RepID=A0ABM3Y1F8_ERIEU|nr:prorelaxin-like [Erinaceus europaeus]
MMKCQLSYLLLGVWLLLCLPPMQEGAGTKSCGKPLIRRIKALCSPFSKREAGPFLDAMPSSVTEDAETLEMKLKPTEMQPSLEDLGQAVFKDSSLNSADVRETVADAQSYLEDNSYIPPQQKSSGLEKHVLQKRGTREMWILMERCCEETCTHEELCKTFCSSKPGKWCSSILKLKG